MNNVFSTSYKMVGIGIAALDKKPNDVALDVFMQETLPSTSGKLSEVKNNKVDTLSNNNANSYKANKGKTITCKWKGTSGSNRMSPPDIRKGESINVYQYGGTDQYYWEPFSYEMDLKTTECVVYGFSNKNKKATNTNEASRLSEMKKMYYFMVDTINKLVKFHSNKDNGEYTTYDFDIKTKDGILQVYDGNGNYLQLNSKTNTWDLTAKGNVTINVGGNTNITTAGTTTIKSANNVVMGPTTFTDQVTLNKGMTAAEDVVAGGISTMTHKHGGILPGSSDTDTPK